MGYIDSLIFALYLGGITIFGASFFRKNKTSTEYTLGNQNIPQWVIALSIFATFVSSISYLALPGTAFQSNWNAFVFSLSIPIASFAALKIFVPLYRKINSPSAYTYLDQRFGPWARIYASASYFLTQLMRSGTILFLLALTLNTIFNWNMVITIIIIGVSVMLYSIFGGIQAVVWTDAIQAIILIFGALFTLIILFIRMPDGPSQIFEIASSYNKFSLGEFRLVFTAPSFWVVLLYGIFINLQNFGVDQNYVQRYVAARNVSDAKKAALTGGLLYIPVSLLFLFIGTALFAFYNSGAGNLPSHIALSENSDNIFPYFILNELPTGLKGILISSIFAAGMSTISTSYNSSATVFFTDYYKRYMHNSISRKKEMKILYLSSATISLCSIFIAILLINVNSALDAWWKLASIFSGGMLGLFLLGITTSKKNKSEAIIAVAAGITIIIWLSVSRFLKINDSQVADLHPYLDIVFGTTSIFLIGFLLSLIRFKFKLNFVKK